MKTKNKRYDVRRGRERRETGRRKRREVGREEARSKQVSVADADVVAVVAG